MAWKSFNNTPLCLQLFTHCIFWPCYQFSMQSKYFSSRFIDPAGKRRELELKSNLFMSVLLKSANDTYPSAITFYFKKRQVRFQFDFMRKIRLNTVKRAEDIDRYRVMTMSIFPIDAMWRQ